MKIYSMFLAALVSALLITSASAQQKTRFSSFGADQAVVQKLEDEWITAIRRSDASALRRILGDDYTGIGPAGDALSKAEEIGRTTDLELESLTVSSQKLKVYVGSAVITGTVTLKGKYKGNDISGDYRYVNVFEVVKNDWKAVYRQLTKVEKEKTEK